MTDVGMVDPVELRNFAGRVSLIARSAPGEYRLVLAEMELEALAEAYALEAAQMGSDRAVDLTFHRPPSSGYPSIKDQLAASLDELPDDVRGASAANGRETRPHPGFVNYGQIVPISGERAKELREQMAHAEGRRGRIMTKDDVRALLRPEVLAAAALEDLRPKKRRRVRLADAYTLGRARVGLDDRSPSAAAPVRNTPGVVPTDGGDSADPAQTSQSVASSPSAGGAGATDDASAPQSWVPTVRVPLSGLLRPRNGIAGFGIEARP